MPDSLDTLAAPPASLDQTLAAEASPDDTLAAGPDHVVARPPRRAGLLPRGETIGRYVVLSKLGAGGMGVVYAAYDPELDRKVALKMLLSDPSGGGSMHTEGRSRLLREAQALAKFAHPEIVGIHDVGEYEGGVWIAMEFVDGGTLGAWAEESPRSWREIVGVMTAAGRGVAAAHAAGMVHRDLKPDNIMVGTDGRVRVMDFGLTRSRGQTPLEADSRQLDERPTQELLSGPLTQQGSLLGTPAYMAPEQFARTEEVTAAADQFSYCATLWELLYGERPFAGRSIMELAAAVLGGQIRPPPKDRRVPNWLRRTCERGLARQPDSRWPSMEALLAELARGQARSRTRNAAIALGVVATLAAGGEGWRRIDRAQRIATCEAEGAAIEERWNDDTRARVRAGLLATNLTYAEVTADKVTPHLDAQAAAWKHHRTEACLHATVDETWDAPTLDRATWCLDERRHEFEALVDEFERADAQVVQRAVTASAGLTNLSTCLDETVLRALPQPPTGDSREAVIVVRNDLGRARALLAAGKYPAGLDLVRPARERAETLDWPPLSAAALALEATLLEKSGEYGESELAGMAAYMTASKASAWGVAADAATDLTYNVGYLQARPAEGRIWAANAEVALGFAGDALGLREMARLNSLATVHFAMGEPAEARALYESGVALREQTFGPDHIEIAASLNNLAVTLATLGEIEASKRVHTRALAIREQNLGLEHPEVAMSLINLGSLHARLGEYDQAKPFYRRAHEIWERALGPEHPDVATALDDLGAIHRLEGEYDQAKLLCEQALVIREKALGPNHPDVAASLTNLANLARSLGDLDQAELLYERGLSIRELALGPEHPDVATSLHNLALVHLEQRDYSTAQQEFERARAIWAEAFGADHTDVALALGNLAHVELELEHPEQALVLLDQAFAIFDAHEGDQEGEVAARFARARARVQSGGDRDRALAEARQARDGYRVGGAEYVDSLADVEAWLAAQESGDE